MNWVPNWMQLPETPSLRWKWKDSLAAESGFILLFSPIGVQVPEVRKSVRCQKRRRKDKKFYSRIIKFYIRFRYDWIASGSEHSFLTHDFPSNFVWRIQEPIKGLFLESHQWSSAAASLSMPGDVTKIMIEKVLGTKWVASSWKARICYRSNSIPFP